MLHARLQYIYDMGIVKASLLEKDSDIVTLDGSFFWMVAMFDMKSVQ